MDEGHGSGGDNSQGEGERNALAQLTDRVAELERQLATLQGAAASERPRAPWPRLSRHPQPEPLQAYPPPRHATASTGFEPPPVPALPPPPRVAAKPLEDRLASQVFNLVGIVALIVGASLALKLAVEHGLLGPAARVVVGLAAGAALILWSEHFRRKALPAFSYTLKAVGSGVLYLALWAAFQLYGLLSAPVALGAMVLVTAWNAFMAFAQVAELLAAYALVGGLLTPVLLSSGGDHETFLFTYLACIVAGVAWLERSKPWTRLVPPTLLATVAYFIGYYVRFFHNARAMAWDDQSTETAMFAFVFFALFALLSTKAWARDPEGKAEPRPGILIPVLVPLANAAFLAFSLYAVFEDSGLHAWLAWLMLALAALMLGLMRVQKTTLAAAMHLACAVILLTVAIPLKVSGHSLTTAWLVEGLALYWASTRVARSEQLTLPKDPAPRRVLNLLAVAGYGLGLASVLVHWTWRFGRQDFFNADLGSALVACAALAGAIWIAESQSSATETNGVERVTLASLSAIAAVALLLTLDEIFAAHFLLPHPAFSSADFFDALIGVVLLGAVALTARRLSRRAGLDAGLASGPGAASPLNLLAALALVLFNLAVILVVNRELDALWTQPADALERSLALSAFLMAYAALLLALGFWRRNAFVRWQALLLLVFTIAKVFLNDISGLSAGYRVTSFLALGALLLTVSYAYQKDWLGLKHAAPADPTPSGPTPSGEDA